MSGGELAWDQVRQSPLAIGVNKLERELNWPVWIDASNSNDH